MRLAQDILENYIGVEEDEEDAAGELSRSRKPDWRVPYPASCFCRSVRLQLSRQSWTIFGLQLRRWRCEHVGAVHGHVRRG